MKWRSTYTVVIALLIAAIPPFTVGMWEFGAFLFSMGLLLLPFELISLRNTGSTISQRMTAMRHDGRHKQFWLVTLSSIIGWLLIMLVHFPFGI